MQACIHEEWDVAEVLISSGSMLEAQDKVRIHLQTPDMYPSAETIIKVDELPYCYNFCM